MKVIDWKPIKGFDGYFINELGYSAGNICEVCNCNRKSAYGYIWRFINE